MTLQTLLRALRKCEWELYVTGYVHCQCDTCKRIRKRFRQSQKLERRIVEMLANQRYWDRVMQAYGEEVKNSMKHLTRNGIFMKRSRNERSTGADSTHAGTTSRREVK